MNPRASKFLLKLITNW